MAKRRRSVRTRKSSSCKIITLKGGRGRRCQCKGKFRKMSSCKRRTTAGQRYFDGSKALVDRCVHTRTADLVIWLFPLLSRALWWRSLNERF